MLANAFGLLGPMLEAMGFRVKNTPTVFFADSSVDGDAGVVTFDDVAGCDGAKLELTEVVDFLKNP